MSWDGTHRRAKDYGGRDISDVVLSIEKSQADQKKILDQQTLDIAEIKALLIGDGKQVGVLEKVRSIEGVFKHVYVIYVAVVGVVVKLVFDVFNHKT